jgi:hypothetical protein
MLHPEGKEYTPPMTDRLETSKREDVSALARLIRVALLVLTLALSSAIVSGDEKERDNLAYLIEALKQVPLVNSGRGSASVIIDNGGQSRKRLVTFMFKGGNTRSDAYEVRKDGPDEPCATWAVNQKNAIVWNMEGAVISSVPPRQFYRIEGYDFHPVVFGSACRKPLSKVLEVLKDSAGKTSVSLDSDGLLHLEYKHEDPATDGCSLLTLVLDTNQGYRLLSFRDLTRNLNGPGSSADIRWNISWKRYGHQWYPEKAVFEQEDVSVLQRGKPIAPRKGTYRVDASIRDFDPDAQVDDAAFTLEGLHLPVGATIVDNIRGIVYKYGGLPADEADLSRALQESMRMGVARETTGKKEGGTSQRGAGPMSDGPPKAGTVPQVGNRNMLVWISLASGAAAITIGWTIWGRVLWRKRS